MDVKWDTPDFDPPMLQFQNLSVLEDELEENQAAGYIAHLNEFKEIEEVILLEYIKGLGRPESDQLIMDYIKSNGFVKRTLEELGILLEELEEFKRDHQELVELTDQLDAMLKEIKLNQRRCWFRQQFRYWTNKKEQQAREAEFMKLKSRVNKIEKKAIKFCSKIFWIFEKFQATNLRSQKQNLDFLPMLAGHCLTGTIQGPLVRTAQKFNFAFESFAGPLKKFQNLDNSWTLWLTSEVGRGITVRFIVTLPFFWCCPKSGPSRILSFGTIGYLLKEFIAYIFLTSDSVFAHRPKDHNFREYEKVMMFLRNKLNSKWFNVLWFSPSILTLLYLKA